MALEITENESLLGENWQSIKLESVKQEVNNENQIVVEKLNEKIENTTKFVRYTQTFESLMRQCGKEELVKICQFLIQLLRDSPEEKMETITKTKRTLFKICELAKKEGLFKSYSPTYFALFIRSIFNDSKNLEELVPVEEDRQLILEKLSKLGVSSIKSRQMNKDKEHAKICQFLIRLLRNWPERKLKKMHGTTIGKILKLAQNEGLFTSRSFWAFRDHVREIVRDEQRLGRLVDEEDKRLILENLPKFGFGMKGRTKGCIDDKELSEICQFFVRLLNNWPEKRIAKMTGPTFGKICKLGREEGLFQKFRVSSYDNVIRRHFLQGQRLDLLVKNKEDRRLILTNMTKLGIGVMLVRNSKRDTEQLKICQFLIQLLRDWPKEELKQMPRRKTLHKIFELAQNEGLFESYSARSFEYHVRDIVENEHRLDKLVDNEEDKRLILDNLSKLGFGVNNRKFDHTRLKSYKKSMESESSEFKQIIQLLLLERQEKMSSFKKIEDLSKQIDYHQQEKIKRQKLANQQQSKILELENELVVLNSRLSKCRQLFP